MIISTLFQVMDCRQTGDKLLPEVMDTQFTYAYIRHLTSINSPLYFSRYLTHLVSMHKNNWCAMRIYGFTVIFRFHFSLLLSSMSLSNQLHMQQPISRLYISYCLVNHITCSLMKNSPTRILFWTRKCTEYHYGYRNLNVVNKLVYSVVC